MQNKYCFNHYIHVETHHFSSFPDYFLRRLIDPVASPLVTLSHCSFWDVRKYICVKLFSLKWKMEMKHLIKGKKWQEQLGKMIKWSSGYNFLLLYFLSLSDKNIKDVKLSSEYLKCLKNVRLLTSVSVFFPSFYFSFVDTIDKSLGQNNYCKINWRKNAITALLAQYYGKYKTEGGIPCMKNVLYPKMH